MATGEPVSGGLVEKQPLETVAVADDAVGAKGVDLETYAQKRRAQMVSCE